MLVFVSHSWRDACLVEVVKGAMHVMNFSSAICKDLANPAKGQPDRTAISSLIQSSDVIFLFLNANVAASDHTGLGRLRGEHFIQLPETTGGVSA